MVGERSMKRGLTVDVLFDLAHFRVHTTMKSRASYIIPLPTTVIGFFFAILGKSREEYIKKRIMFKAGAKLLEIKGICREYAQLLKLHSKWRERPQKSTEELIILFRPKYRFAIWGSKETIDELYDRINEFSFEFVPYAGINDFIFFDVENPKLYNKYKEMDEIENTYLPQNLFSSLEMSENSIIYNLPYVYSGLPKTVIMGLNVKFKLKEKVSVIGGVPLYDCFLRL